ncbi:sugar porter family MFS transporter [Rudaea cellulosilytica]|uniref:sugar porter family MFS transporter n=1 Tax=Rudaea cellulosilytica TaxID=540746 RepID=UPI0003788BAE|nr:sugar porter family MFS transporter [Rudaea cellulosilytica]
MEITFAGDRNTTHTGGTSRMLVAGAFVAALGSLLFGFDTAVISGTTESLRQVFALTDNLLGLTVSSALIGTLFGAFLVGRPADWWGRKPVLAGLAFVFVVASLGCAMAWNWYALLAFRWLGGVAVGGASVVSPLYITEIAPPKRRGVLVAISQLNIVLGILLAYLSNYFVAWALGADATNDWRWMFGVMAIPSVVFLCTVLALPESPRWLVRQRRMDDAEKALTRFGHEDPGAEVREIAESMHADIEGHHASLFQRKYLRPLLFAFAIAAFNQLDGINAVIYYTADIFRMAGASKTSALSQSVILGFTNLVLTLVAMAVIDRIGRRALLLAGSVTFVFSHLLAAWVFYSHAHGWIVILAMMGVVGSHSYSQGAVVWVYINEILPNAIRASGSAVVCFSLWVICAAVSWMFPVLVGISAFAPFLFFGAMMVAQFVFVWIALPETKGVSLEELQRRLGIQE